MGNRSYRQGDVPIPGYSLHEYLGRGGFGEVWKATGPGGVQAAIKIIHDLDRKKGGKELRALRLLRNIRHPNLVPLLGFWLKSPDGELVSDDAAAEYQSAADRKSGDTAAARGTMLPTSHHTASLALAPEPTELIIAMGLCEKSLFDRLAECQAGGVPGVPFDELLTCMEDAARAIDLLNAKHDIQHCDIKPQNILLLSGAAQVCDFGLATAIGDVRESSMGAGTIAYGAPEVLLGKGPSHSTDQYSLAISYFELRTGALPFGSERISDVLNAKQGGQVDLSLLTPGEQEVIAQAVSLDPGARFSNTVEMVRALRHVGASCQPDTLRIFAGRPDGRNSLMDTLSGKSDMTRSGRPRTPLRRTQAAVMGAGLLALAAVVAALGLFAFSGGDADNRSVADNASPASSGRVGTIHSQDQRAPRELAGKADWTTARLASDANSEPPENVAATAVPSGVDRQTPKDRSADHPSNGDPVHRPEHQPTRLPEVTGRTAEPSQQVVEATRQSAENTERITAATRETAANTSSIAESARLTADNTRQIAEAASRISLSLDALREEFAAATSRGGIIADPQQPTDFYHNARMYEQRGDYSSARRSYTRFLAFHLNVVDPHLRFQRILKMQDGRSAARDIYAEMKAPPEDLATQFAAILLEPDDLRTRKLTDFVAAHPQFAPAVYELGDLFSNRHLNVRGLADMAHEKELLLQFVRLVEEGQLLRYFLDQSEAAEMVEDAQARLAAFEQFDEGVFQHPVGLTAMRSNTSWTVNLAIAETARNIFYRVDGQPDYINTGHHALVDQRTGSPSPKTHFELPPHAGRTAVSVMYTDIRGHKQGPFQLEFDPELELVRGGKSILEGHPNGWVVFREWEGRVLAYFSHLVSYRYAIQEIRYSVNTEGLNELFPLTPADPLDPHTVPPGTQTYITAPYGTTFIAVQLTYRDGTKSKVVHFENKLAQVADPGTTAAQTAPQANGHPNGQPQGRGGPLRNLDVDIGVDADINSRRPPRVRFGIGF